MSAVLVDSSVLLDILLPDPDWEDWSSETLARVADRSPLVINPVIYGEVSIGFRDIETLDASLPPAFRREAIPWDAAFLAGKSFVAYRRRGGARRAPLPDFFIGAHAAVRGHRILTRDPGRFRTYFPTVTVIAPS